MPPLEHGEPLLAEALGLVARQALELEPCSGSPRHSASASQARRRRGGILRQPRLGIGGQPLEGVGVELVGLEHEHVAAGPRGDGRPRRAAAAARRRSPAPPSQRSPAAPRPRAPRSAVPARRPRRDAAAARPAASAAWLAPSSRGRPSCRDLERTEDPKLHHVSSLRATVRYRLSPLGGERPDASPRRSSCRARPTWRRRARRRSGRAAGRPAPRRPSGRRRPRRSGRAASTERTRSSTSQASPSPQSGRITPNSAPSSRAIMSTSRSCARHADEDSLTRRSPSCSLRSMLNALRWSRSMHRDRDRRLRAAGAGELARQLVVPRAAGAEAGQRIRQRERADARAQLLALDRHRGLGGQQREHVGDGVGDRLDGVAPDQDQHAGDLVAAQHRLEQRRARAGRLHQRRRRAPGGRGRRRRSSSGAT